MTWLLYGADSNFTSVIGARQGYHYHMFPKLKSQVRLIFIAFAIAILVLAIVMSIIR